MDRSCTTSRPLNDFDRPETSIATSDAFMATWLIERPSGCRGIELNGDRLPDAKTVRPIGTRLYQEHQLVALLEAVDHRRRIFGLSGDEIDLCRQIGRTVVTGDVDVLPDPEFWQIRLRHEKPDLHIARRHDRQHRPLRWRHFAFAKINL